MLKKNEEAELDGTVKRWSVDCKATVKLGDFSRGGQTRGDDQASVMILVVKRPIRRAVLWMKRVLNSIWSLAVPTKRVTLLSIVLKRSGIG